MTRKIITLKHLSIKSLRLKDELAHNPQSQAPHLKAQPPQSSNEALSNI